MNDLSVESIKALAKQQREHFAQSEDSILSKLKQDFVAKMKKSLEKGSESFELELPYQLSDSKALKTLFFSFLTDLGATFSEHYHSGDPRDPREYSYHYLKINCQNI